MGTISGITKMDNMTITITITINGIIIRGMINMAIMTTINRTIKCNISQVKSSHRIKMEWAWEEEWIQWVVERKQLLILAWLVVTRTSLDSKSRGQTQVTPVVVVASLVKQPVVHLILDALKKAKTKVKAKPQSESQCLLTSRSTMEL